MIGQHDATIIDAGLDYLTLTITPKMAGMKDFDRIAHAWFADKESNGYQAKEARSKGYEGWRLGGTFYGKREDSCIWETAGGLSQEVGRWVADCGVKPRVTRADVQVTYVCGEVRDGWAHDTLEAAERRAASLGRSTRQTVGVFATRGRDTGFTLGRRGCPNFFRAYLAGVQHPEKYPPNSIRDECEFRGDRAPDVWAMSLQASDSGQFAKNVVRSRMEKLSMSAPWHHSAETLPFPAHPYDESELRTLYWLENHICPVIKKLARGQHREKLVEMLQAALKYEPEIVGHSETLALNNEYEKRRCNNG